MAGLTRLDPPARQARSWLFVAGFGLGGRRVKSPRAAADVSRGDRARIGRADVGERWEAVVGEETWHAARLIPTSGINGAEEQERRATSALLAVTTAVREFGRSLTTRFGAPAGAVEAFIEVPFDVGDTTLYPDLDEVTEAGVPPALVSTSLSSQDGVELEGMATAGTVVERPDVVQTPDSD